jgi:hypothetical protein
MAVANYSSDHFAPGNDPRVCTPHSEGSPVLALGSARRTASITETSSIQPENGLEPPVPLETEPLIGSESTSIASRRCAVPVSTVSNMTAAPALRTRQVPQD